MTAGPERSGADAIAEAALASVFDPDLVRGLREDSPLSALGLSDADLVCLADGVLDASASRGAAVVLEDADLEGVATVADLVRVIEGRMGA